MTRYADVPDFYADRVPAYKSATIQVDREALEALMKLARDFADAEEAATSIEEHVDGGSYYERPAEVSLARTATRNQHSLRAAVTAVACALRRTADTERIVGEALETALGAPPKSVNLTVQLRAAPVVSLRCHGSSGADADLRDYAARAEESLKVAYRFDRKLPLKPVVESAVVCG